MERVIEYLLTASDEEIGQIRLKDVSKKLSTPVILLALSFLLSRKEAFGSFVERHKLLRAAHHLEQDREVNIDELSKRLGFGSRNLFSKKFYKYYLVEPERYWQLGQLKRYSYEDYRNKVF